MSLTVRGWLAVCGVAIVMVLTWGGVLWYQCW